jgi:prevent-host-death family protein
MNLSPNLTPLTEVRRHTAEIFEQVRATKQPVMVTEHGREAGVIMDPEAFHALNSRLAVLEEIAMGETEIAQGLSVSWKEVKADLKKWQR